MKKADGYSEIQAKMLYILAQNELFAPDFAVPLMRLAADMGKSKRSTRSVLSALEDCGDVLLVTKRPMRFSLSGEMRAKLGIGGR